MKIFGIFHYSRAVVKLKRRIRGRQIFYLKILILSVIVEIKYCLQVVLHVVGILAGQLFSSGAHIVNLAFFEKKRADANDTVPADFI